MRIEYNTNESMGMLKSSIKDFMSNFTHLYTLTIDNSINIVYHVIKYDIDLVFTEETLAGKNFIACFLVKSFSSSYATSNNWFIHADNIPKWVGDTVQHDIPITQSCPGLAYKVTMPVYYPCVVLLPSSKMVANYNSKNDTIMFSSVQYKNVPFSGVNTMNLALNSTNLIISDSEKYLDFDGGLFIAGTNCGCMEYNIRRALYRDGLCSLYWVADGTTLYFIADSHANCAYFHVQPVPRCYTGPWTYPWVNDPYNTYNNRVRSDKQSISSNLPDMRNHWAFDIILYGKIDNAPYRNRGELAHFLTRNQAGFPSYCAVAGGAFSSESTLAGVNIHRYADWCLSFQPSPKLYDNWTDGSEGRIDYFYPIAVPSITNSTIKVPRYEPLLSADMLDNGHNVNVLNDISMVMPLYISVRRDPPEEPLSYSAVCRNDVINLVNMRYMSTNKMTNGIYPVEEYTYNCFNIFARQNLSGFKGYQGIAFRQEDEE